MNPYERALEVWQNILNSFPYIFAKVDRELWGSRWQMGALCTEQEIQDILKTILQTDDRPAIKPRKLPLP